MSIFKVARNSMQRVVQSRLLVALVSVIVTLLGVAWLSCGQELASPAASVSAKGAPLNLNADKLSTNPLELASELWSCSMHPHIHRDGPGACPICGMDLIRVSRFESNDTDRSRQLRVTEAQKALMRIATVPVERRFPTASLRLAGKVAYDETNLADITAWIPGRIDRLFVDYTGLSVNQGDHMIELYSPELYSAQVELLQARAGTRDLSSSGMASLRAAAEGTVKAARDKLRLSGLTPEQITQLEASGKAEERVTIFSPSSGVVIRKDVQEGMYVETGTRMLTIADLSSVWVQLDAYESDLQWLRAGQKVSFYTEAFPGEEFQGRIAFIDPVLNPETRTVKVRVNVNNPEQRLKPEMFVRASVSARLAVDGLAGDDYLAGKWVSPMHPEHFSDKPGSCPVCGMALVQTPSTAAAERSELPSTNTVLPPLVIPATAALLTGQRAIVYVEVPKADVPTYEGRVVTLGARAGADYIVESGLAEGDRVVVSGNFQIDSALQIQARPSMMNPPIELDAGGHNHDGH